MATTAFRVENGLAPGHVNNDLGHTTAKFRNIHLSNDANVGGDLDVDGSTSLQNLTAVGSVTLPQFSGGGGGGGVSTAQAIAFAVALG